jgi:hypothetical protein
MSRQGLFFFHFLVVLLVVFLLRVSTQRKMLDHPPMLTFSSAYTRKNKYNAVLKSTLSYHKLNHQMDASAWTFGPPRAGGGSGLGWPTRGCANVSVHVADSYGDGILPGE